MRLHPQAFVFYGAPCDCRAQSFRFVERSISDTYLQWFCNHHQVSGYTVNEDQPRYLLMLVYKDLYEMVRASSSAPEAQSEPRC